QMVQALDLVFGNQESIPYFVLFSAAVFSSLIMAVYRERMLARQPPFLLPLEVIEVNSRLRARPGTGHRRPWRRGIIMNIIRTTCVLPS
ncbi:hypothetical protein LJB86_06065, partial [Deltaproteobacteria bacterium OttesenSCG-928-M10]|nr:hypothetical protein [Deltaproteobacteria bacterium OttesenSCG-928-M10]